MTSLTNRFHFVINTMYILITMVTSRGYKIAAVFFISAIPILMLGGIKDRYLGAASFIFLDRQPSARTEALGRASVAIMSGASALYFNPAGIACGKLIEVEAMSGTRRIAILDADPIRFKYIGGSVRVRRGTAIAVSNLSIHYYNKGIDATNGWFDLSAVGMASSIGNAFAIGMTVNRVHEDWESWSILSRTGYPIDIGIMGRFALTSSSARRQFTFGATMTNVNFEMYGEGKTKDVLPTIIRLATAYSFTNVKLPLFPGKRPLDCLVTVEYQDVLNTEYFTSGRIGMESSWAKLIYLRIGYYYTNKNDYGYSNNASYHSEFTYGAGIRIPLADIPRKNLPLILIVDYVSLPQPVDYFPAGKLDNFYCLNLTIRYGTE